MAMNTLEPKLVEYVRTTFPLHAKIVKLVSINKGKAETILIKAGKKHGVNVGDSFMVTAIEMLDGEEIPTEIGTITVSKLVGENFSECKVSKKALAYSDEMFILL